MPLFYTGMLQVRNKCCVYWFRPEYDLQFSFTKRTYLISNFKEKKTYSGMITASTAKRIRLAVDLLLQISPSKKVTNPFTKALIQHRLSFITLTIPETSKNYTPKYAHGKILKPFLRYMREKESMNTYIWKAEFQERGQLHYHITTNSVIDLRIIRKYWNGLLIKNKMLESFYEKFGHYDPNSTDIHSVRKLHDIQGYLTKYLIKTEQNQTPTSGKIWDCSANLKGKKHMSFVSEKVNDLKILKASDCEKIKIKDLEHCGIIDCIKIKPTELLSSEQIKKYNEYRLSIRDVKPEPMRPKVKLL